MNSAVIEVAEKFADKHHLPLRDVFARFRRARVEFRTETNYTYDGNLKIEAAVFLGFAYEGLFYPYNDENHQILETLMLDAYKGGPRKHPREPEAPAVEDQKTEKPSKAGPDAGPTPEVEREPVETAG